MTYRVAADILVPLLPIDAGKSPETLRSHTLRVGEQHGDAAADQPATAAAAIAVSLDSTFVRGSEDGERHLEVRVGNVETTTGGRQVFAAVAKADTDIAGLIRRDLETVGQTENTAVTAFTDGCPSLRCVLADAGITKPPILDWFHIAMRCDGPGEAPISCSRSAVRSTTGRSGQGSAADLGRSQIQNRCLPGRHDPPNLWTVPAPERQTIALAR